MHDVQLACRMHEAWPTMTVLSSGLAGAYDESSIAYPILSIVVALAALGAYIACFVMGIKTGKLTTLDYIVGSVGLVCGLGWLYFIYRVDRATLQRSFDIVSAGGDPAEARALNKQFRIAAALAFVLAITSFFLR